MRRRRRSLEREKDDKRNRRVGSHVVRSDDEVSEANLSQACFFALGGNVDCPLHEGDAVYTARQSDTTVGRRRPFSSDRFHPPPHPATIFGVEK